MHFRTREKKHGVSSVGNFQINSKTLDLITPYIVTKEIDFTAEELIR